ncbi:MAG: Lytic transglycosylase catalytic, partial [Variovorax sp.]|nr:Lytic transglycosylase catalytic [Variovorax sp.]
NMRVGVKVLQECISRAGSLEAGLRYYVGAANLEDDGGYANKVMAEHERLRLVAGGSKSVPTTPTAAPPVIRTQTTTPRPALPVAAAPVKGDSTNVADAGDGQKVAALAGF